MARVRQARRCSARRTNGQPCKNYAILGGRVCRKHGGGAPQVRRKADERLFQAAAYRVLVQWTYGSRQRDYWDMRSQAFPDGDPDRRFLEAAARKFETDQAAEEKQAAARQRHMRH